MRDLGGKSEMVRRAVVAGDSSTSSAESSFRELDEVFLQTQTRIWLGEVLNTRLDEDLHISDLLQDGELLFEVSKVVWDLLLTKCVELRHLKHKYGPFGSRKCSGRYRPYSNVDSFLKICNILGLSGIDLFSPSDVVEKRDIRKVCICIRALSKKAMSKQLRVPDFDMVIYSVAMPTDMVGCIRRSLESSQCTLSSSSSSSTQKGSRTNLKKKNYYAPSDRDDDSCSEESDEAESRYMGENNSFSSASNFNDAAKEYSPERYPSFGQHREGRNVFESDLKCQYREEIKCGKSFSPENHENGSRLSHDKVSQQNLCHDNVHIDNKVRHRCMSGALDPSHVNITFSNDNSVVTDSSYIRGGENNFISDYLAFSDMMVQANDGTNSVVHNGENNLFDFFLNFESQRKFSDDEDMEVSSTTSMTSVLGRVLNLEFDDQFDADDSPTANVDSSGSMEHDAENHYLSSVSSINFPPSQSKCRLSAMKSLEDESCGHRSGNLENAFCLDDGKVVVSHVADILQANQWETISESYPCVPVKVMNKAHEADCVAYGPRDEDISCTAEHDSQDKQEHDLDIQAERISDEKKDITQGRKPLLKKVVKGAAVAGVLFLFLRFRKGRVVNAQETNQLPKYKEPTFSQTKQHRVSRQAGIYPAGKFKL